MVLAITLVVDSNILFAAAIKSGDTARLLLSDRLHLIAPDWLFEEFGSNKEILLRKTHRSDEDFEKFLEILEERIETVPRAEFEPWIEEAKKHSTPNDFPFAALAKAYNCAVWSNDKGFKEMMRKTGFVEVINTGELLERLMLK